MFELTRLSDDTFLVNPDIIKVVEELGDTVLTLMSGEKVLVKESANEIRSLFLQYKKEIMNSPIYPSDSL